MVDDLEVFQASRSGTIAGRSSLLMVTNIDRYYTYLHILYSSVQADEK